MIAVSGQSCGALEALEAAADPRVKTAIIFNSGIMRGMPPEFMMKGPDGKTVTVIVPGTEETLKKLHTPVIYLIGGEKTSRIKTRKLIISKSKAFRYSTLTWTTLATTGR